MMAMDQMVDKPENYGLRNPAGAVSMQGMMTFIRVLQPDKYDEVMERNPAGALFDKWNARSREIAPGEMEMKKTMQGVLILWAAVAIVQQPGAAQEQHPHEVAGSSSSRFGAGLSNELAPDLLKDVMSRPAMKLSDFEPDGHREQSERLREAAAMAQRSAGQAQQAGLLPNPSIGYQGEQIRGGSHRGGEQGAFIQQTFVLGGKLKWDVGYSRSSVRKPR